MYEKELRLAELAVQRATLFTLKVLSSFSKDDALDKPDNTPVTIGDLGAQALIISALHAAFPGDKFVAEESASFLREDAELAQKVWQMITEVALEDADSEKLLAKPSSLEAMLDIIDLGCGSGGQDRIWVLDPIDGTKTFMKSQQYAVCLCLVVHGEQKVGVLGCPKLCLETSKISETTVPRNGNGYLVSAVKGQGATLRPLSSAGLQPARPAPAIVHPAEKKPELVDCVASTSMNAEKHREIAEHLGIDWPGTEIWSTQMKYIALAVGGHDLWIRIPQKPSHRTAVWDHAGGHLIYEEVGGKVTDIYGKKIDFGAGRRCENNFGNIAAAPALHSQVLAVVRKLITKDNKD
ncbi:3'(2'),5'-bisphosphate nucleotidase [Verruconis gallopava]|uniref:3'(2'),5'-bisphosphate nucleotidase n=1 Tax=Verruconis gallopava TaxID=253628 RepID=A0A0D2AAL0_9PEZI|nr:3'(2'),5'-bisphosphate nucleotidase [Verruconis gallopava]KIW03605.1 3'(2'),5'-bisphosphate nucleotidase [Verruconis gallopava]